MSEDFDLIAEIREDQGKGASRRLRHQGKVPAIIYGAGRPPRALTFDQNKVLHQLDNESFYSSVLNIKVGDKSQAAILKDLQRHPAKHMIMHMDFQRIVDDVEIRMNVPLHFIGEDVAPGVKTGGGVVSHLMSELEISCLPKDLPEYIEVDVSALEMDGVVHLSDVNVPDGVELMALTHGSTEHDQAVVTINRPRAEEVEEAPEADEAGAEGDAAAPAEGDASGDADGDGKNEG